MHAVQILRWSLGFVNWLPSTPQRRSRIGSIKKGGEQVWEAASPRARSTGFGLLTTFHLTAPKGLGSVPAGNEAMDATQPWRRRNC